MSLFEIMKKGDFTSLYNMIKDGSIVSNEQIWWEFTQRTKKIKLQLPLLHIAAAQGKYKIASVLIRFGAVVDAKDKYGTTAMHWAATVGNTKMVKLLLKHNADVNALDLLSMTPLITAAYSGRTKTVKYLLKRGADPSITSKQNERALDLAKRRNNKNCVAVLKKKMNLSKVHKSRSKNPSLCFQESHDRNSTTLIHDDGTEIAHNEELMHLQKGDLSLLCLRESSSELAEEEVALQLRQITDERVNELKTESKSLRRNILSLQSETKQLKSVHKHKHKAVSKQKQYAKKLKQRLHKLKKKQKTKNKELDKKNDEVNALKQQTKKQKQNMVLSEYNEDELKAELYDKLTVLRRMNDVNRRLQKQRDKLKQATEKDKQQEFNHWLHDIVCLPCYETHFEKYEYNRLDIVKHLDPRELRQIGIKQLQHRMTFMKQIHKLQTKCKSDLEIGF